MEFVKTDDLEVGMISTKNIYDNEHRLLLSANHTLTPQIIGALKRMDYYGLIVYDEFSDLEEYKSYLSEETRMDAVRAMKDLSIDRVMFCVNAIVDDLLKETDDILIDMDDIRLYDNDTYQHSVNVCLLSTACGIVMGFDDKKLRSLAAGAMLHDIGKRSIPLSILNKPGKLTDEEFAVIKSHPQRGYDMLYDNSMLTPDARTCVLCHHENWDGSGYPNHFKGDEIPPLARIVHVADVYDAMCQKRAYKGEYNPCDVIEFLSAKCGSMFDIEVVTQFLKSVVVFPVGTDVTLSDGRVCRVIKNRAGAVTRPVVVDKETGDVIDLCDDESTYSITISNSGKVDMIESEIRLGRIPDNKEMSKTA